MAAFRNRIVEQRMVRVADVGEMPENFRAHTAEQHDAVSQAIVDVGFIDPFDVWVRADGSLCLFDGHLRRQLIEAQLGPDTLVSCNVTDLTEAEAYKALLTKDSLTVMANVDADKMRALMAMVSGTTPPTEVPIPDFAPSKRAAPKPPEEKKPIKTIVPDKALSGPLVDVLCSKCGETFVIDREKIVGEAKPAV